MVENDESQKKKYGLIIKKKETPLEKLTVASRLKPVTVFDELEGSDSDSEKATTSGPVSKYGSVTGKRQLRKQEEREAERALEQDPTVFQYDEIYDDIQQQKMGEIPEEDRKADKERKPKYIQNLLKAATKRQRDHEMREERKQHKERLNEGDEFADKEVFITAAYRKKMEEIAKHEEEEQRQEMFDEMTDVKKQKTFSGFYRHMLEQRVRPSTSETTTEVKDEPMEDDDKNDAPTTSTVSPNPPEDELASKFKPKKATKTRPAGAEKNGNVKRYRTAEQRISDDEEVTSEQPVDKATKNRTIYSSSSDSESENNRPSSPPPRKGGLQIMKKKVEKKKAVSKKRSHSSDESSDDSEGAESTTSPIKPVETKVTNTDSAAAPELFVKQETDEEKLEKLRVMFARKNDDAAVEAYRERYFQRLKLRQEVATNG